MCHCERWSDCLYHSSWWNTAFWITISHHICGYSHEQVHLWSVSRLDWHLTTNARRRTCLPPNKIFGSPPFLHENALVWEVPSIPQNVSEVAAVEYFQRNSCYMHVPEFLLGLGYVDDIIVSLNTTCCALSDAIVPEYSFLHCKW